MEVYVQPFPGPGPRTVVSSNGGAQPRWRRDGRELFYIALDDRLTAVTVRGNDAMLQTGTPMPLFATRVGGAVQDLTTALYNVSADGERFLMSNLLPDASTSPITVILNWKPKS
jgi:hypothetical protein